MAKRPDVGMAGSSGYDSEFYTTDKTGKAQRNERTMKLQGMDPKKRTADSMAQEIRVNTRNRNDIPMTDRDKARMKAVGGEYGYGNGGYDEKVFQNSIGGDDFDKREAAVARGYSARVDIDKQKRQASVMQKFGDNSFKSAAPMTKAMMADYKKKSK
jgi:hypothetical protein